MKHRTLILTAFLILLTGVIQAQERKNLVKTSLFFPLLETFTLSFERVLNEEMSLQATVFAGDISDFAVMPEFRYYLSENRIAPSGTFVAPYLFIGEEAGGGIMVGVQRLFKSKISLDAFLGPMVRGDGVAAMGGINLGIAF